MTQRYFLVIRDRHAGKTAVQEFSNADVAISAYGEAEREHLRDIMGKDPLLEIVLIGGESLAEVSRAYPHYFTKGTRQQRREQMLRNLPKVAPG